MTTIGLDVGGTKILGVVADGSGAVLAEHRSFTPFEDGEATVEAMAGVVRALRGDHDVSAVGAGVAGLVTRAGVVRFSPNLPGMVELPVGDLLSEAVGLPVTLDNDATCALRAEHRLGAAAGVDDVALVALGTGIGGAVVLDGEPRRGASGFAGEIGHQVVVAGGIPCVCGRRGCWEQYASGSALGRLAGGRGEDVTAAAANGDARALAHVEELAGWVALGLVNLVQTLDVARILISGGLIGAGDVLVDPIRAAYAVQAVSPAHRPPVEIVAAELGVRAGAIGAALLALPVP